MPLRFLLLTCALPLLACGSGAGPGQRELGPGTVYDLAAAGAPDLLPARDLGHAELGDGDDGGTTLTIVHQLPGVTVTTLAGSGVAGARDGKGSAAFFDNPVGLAL